MKATLRWVTDKAVRYQALMFVCPGCEAMKSRGTGSGLHMLPVNTTEKSPSWTFDGNLERPTLSPSILTRYPIGEKTEICHSFLRNGVFEFLNDCTHPLAGQKVEIPDLYDWVTDKKEER